MNELYYIQDTRSFLGNALVWWAKDSKGYTANIDNAGKYTKEQTKSICRRETDKAWPCSYIDNVQKVPTIDSQKVDFKNRKSWRGGRKKKVALACLQCGRKIVSGDFCSKGHENEYNNLPY